jgi:lipopolysaccharide transport system ATP-binding protein
MSSEYAITAQQLSKRYALFHRPSDRLKQLLLGRWRRYAHEFHALQDVSFAIRTGEVVGIVGRNGAGKSTLLQLVCGTLEPTTGTLAVRGRVAALLELGAGFSPDFTGLENIYINAAILGLSRAQVDAQLDAILAFADIGDFIHQPVKTYSSGMFMRLAFAVATSVEPDILVIDEALSVGDGAFARKSFDRIMRLKDAGKTILFCSHSMYQIEALCSRALWFDAGRLRMDGTPAEVTSAYSASLNADPAKGQGATLAPGAMAAGAGLGRIVEISAQVDDEPVPHGMAAQLLSGHSTLILTLRFSIDPTLPTPALALGISDANGLTIASATTHNDGFEVQMDTLGQGQVTIVFEKFPLLKGRYSVTAFLVSEDAVHVYDQVERSVLVDVRQKGLEQGLVRLPHHWQA